MASDSAIRLYSESDENSDVLREIDSGTQIEVYECETEGWYRAEIAKADGSDEYDVGYVKAEYIAEIPDYDMDEYVPSLGDIAGEWIYEEQDVDITDQYVGVPIGRYAISDDGEYTYTTDGTSFVSGTVGIDYEEYADGSRVPLFVFYDEGGEAFMACAAAAPEERTDGCLYIGNAGESRLVPADSPASGEAYITDIVGVWNETDAFNPRILTVNEDGTFKLEFKGGRATFGTVEIIYEDHPDGSQTPWFNFYKDDGTIWAGFQKTDGPVMNDLYAGHTGEPHFVRAS